MNEYYEILLSEYIKPPSNMIIENIEGLSGSILKSFIRHNNIVATYIEFDKAINNKENNSNNKENNSNNKENNNNNPNYKEKLITYIKSQITINAGYDEKQRIESLVKYILQKNYFLSF
jgi:hypothetical protein